MGTLDRDEKFAPVPRDVDRQQDIWDLRALASTSTVHRLGILTWLIILFCRSQTMESRITDSSLELEFAYHGHDRGLVSIITYRTDRGDLEEGDFDDLGGIALRLFVRALRRR